MLNKLKNLISLAYLTRSGAGGGQFPIFQIGYLGKVADCAGLFPFGLHSIPSVGSLAVVFNINGNAESKAAIIISNTRPDLKAGEVALYHPDTGATVKMNSDGTVTISADSIKLDGDVSITGDLVVKGKDFLTHTHGISSGSSSPGPTGGVT